ncbi:flagellar motor protein MotB [Cupriavidus sp. UYMMa02A]|nr:flagellar motor protein MotB [Cupriavidus sp. UYMMa02A]
MTGYPYRTLFGWIAALALAWLGLSSPWSMAWNLLLAGVVVVSAIMAVLVATRRVRARKRGSQAVLEAIDRSLESLPGDTRRNTALVLTVGDGVPALVFGEALVRMTDTAIWVRVDEPNRLAHVADALKRWREGQGPDAITCLISADQVREPASLSAGLRRWRSAIGEASRAVGYSLPVCLAVYAEEAGGPPDDCPWFSVTGWDLPPADVLCAQLADQIAQYPLAAMPADRAARMRRAARLDALTRWSTGAVLPALRDDVRDGLRSGRPVRIAAFGVIATTGVPAPDSLFASFISQTTGLAAVAREGRRASYGLPDPLICGIALQPGRRALPHALAHAFAWLALAFCAAAAASAWQNRALVERVVQDMARYRAIGVERDAARVDALQALKQDRDELERYQRAGVPPRLGLGFYRGANLLAPLNALIATYQPPGPPPSTIELDSLSLFRSGSAVLNPGSNRVLIGALEMIKAHADKRVLVAGHTDAVGSAQANLKLSEARAASVRDWLADAAGLPPTHFAIQGYGDTRPKAPNDTDAGRAANRRVEITLVPDCRDDHRSNRAISGHPACSFQ